ncbi:histidine kinase [Hymenobacter taeanensis]|uniref:Histidine kinase n=2 Tax=Hymenobacter TaxID=89966 RepID=A0A6M6BEP8_9BACT|nr:histidine kinase [Hymenobacter taeanensis]QJX45635.1 histidine kinase [Hymenobacter taeanensis]
MDINTLDFQQVRIKHILFKSQLRSVLYGVREPDAALFLPQGNALGQWLTGVVKPKFPNRLEIVEAERLLRQLLNTGSELVAQYQRGQIDEARRGMTQIDRLGDQLITQLEKLAPPAGTYAGAA